MIKKTITLTILAGALLLNLVGCAKTDKSSKDETKVAEIKDCRDEIDRVAKDYLKYNGPGTKTFTYEGQDEESDKAVIVLEKVLYAFMNVDHRDPKNTEKVMKVFDAVVEPTYREYIDEWFIESYAPNNIALTDVDIINAVPVAYQVNGGRENSYMIAFRYQYLYADDDSLTVNDGITYASIASVGGEYKFLSAFFHNAIEDEELLKKDGIYDEQKYLIGESDSDENEEDEQP